MIVFVADLFASDYVGGAELTLEALIEKCPFPFERVHSQQLTKNFIDDNKEKFWIFGNTALLQESLLFYIAKNLNYSAIECDYKFCSYRLPERHLHHEQKECDCENSRRGKLYSLFYHSAKSMWWMSEAQKQIWIDKFPFLEKKFSFILSSVFDDKTLELFDNFESSQKSEKVGIVASPQWVKGVQNSIDFAEKNNLEYELIQSLAYVDLLKKMSTLSGLVMMPNGGDTCPRIVIEAKLLGCQLYINDNVQHQNETWFTDRETILSYLKKQKSNFWKVVSQTIGDIVSDYFVENKYSFACPSYNEGYRLERFLRSCLGLDGLDEIHVVDHRSNDNTSEILEKMKTQLASVHKKLIMTHEARDFSKNFTMADLRNVAVNGCSNSVVYSVDADWIFGPNFEIMMYQAFKKLEQENRFAVGHRMYSVDEFIEIKNNKVKGHGDSFAHVAIPRIILKDFTTCRQTGANGKYFEFLPTEPNRSKWVELKYLKNSVLAINDKPEERKKLRTTMNKFFELSLKDKNYSDKTWLDSYGKGILESDVTPLDYYHVDNKVDIDFCGEEYFG
jgi:glycosyltransferase involved in cell wall biosynthesis